MGLEGKSSHGKALQSYGDSAKHHIQRLRRFQEGVGAKRKSESGRPAAKLPPKQANKKMKEILSKVMVSQAKMGRKYGVYRTMIGKVLKKSKVDWIKRKSAPKYHPGQKERAKKAAGILRRVKILYQRTNIFTPN